MFDQIAPGVYEPGDSPLHRMQARTKLLTVGWIVLTLFVAGQREGHFAPYGVALVLTCVAVALSVIPPTFVLRPGYGPAS